MGSAISASDANGRTRVAAVMGISATTGESPAARVTATPERCVPKRAYVPYVGVGSDHAHGALCQRFVVDVDGPADGVGTKPSVGAANDLQGCWALR